MTIKKLTYIGLTLLTACLAACSDDVTMPNTLSGDGEKTPLGVTALLDAGGAATRAANMEFASGDALLAYLRHVKWNVSTGVRTLVSIQNSPVLVTFTKGSTAMTAYDGADITPIGIGTALGLTSTNTQKAADLTADPVLYWDDFSANGVSDNTDASLNIREDGHYLQSFYGYCYNGGTPSAALVENTGVLGWQVSTNQNDGAGKSAFKTSDLLWSAEQTPIAYAHVDGEGKKNHGTLVLPYTHAMSKVTIKVTLDNSFGTGVNFSGVTTKLHEMFTHCTCTAPTYTLTNKGTETVGQTITMWNKEFANSNTIKECTFEAIVVPSVLSVVNNFATITGLDGNKYVIPITDKMLQKGSEHGGKGWGDELTETDEHISGGIAQKPANTRADGGPISMGKGYEMKSGVNYVLDVNVSKQEITVSATIKDWIDVTAEGKALVEFNPNVDGKGEIANELKAKGFDVYKNSVNTTFDTKTTTLEWDNTNKIWEYNPKVYWGGQGDAAYFRAVSPINASLSMNQGTDMLWGYACDDDANNGNKIGTGAEVKITPRTGDVPLHFIHPMSKISVELKTSDDPAKQVNLTGAKLSVINLYDTGNLSMSDGTIGSLGNSSSDPYTFINETFDGMNKWSNKIVIPQSLVNDKDGNPRTVFPAFNDLGSLTDRGDKIMMYITLADGTRYRLELSSCVVTETGLPVTAWERGKHYTYTINIEKEAITFRALIKEWEETKGGGNATLEWD